MAWIRFVVGVSISVVFCACAPSPQSSSVEQSPRWAIAIHGGAGVIDSTKLGHLAPEYVDGLQRGLDVGVAILDSGGTSLDAVEEVLSVMENNPLFNAGKGAVFNWEGEHELDASIMNGRDRACGAVTGVRTVKNPIRLARMVMERSKHVLFAGAGAESFANQMAVERVDPSYFFTQRRYESWQKMREKAEELGTVGCVALDRDGQLAAGTSTGGLTGKRFGRVGDSPIVGAGTWADNATCAVSCTGTGEEFIRHGVAQRIADLMEYRGATLHEAVAEVVHEVLREGDGGVIALDGRGNIAMEFNTGGMFRGAATSDGRSEVAIWDDPEP